MKHSSNADIDVDFRKYLYIYNNKDSVIGKVKNYVNEFEWIIGKYYKEGSLFAYEGTRCTKPIKLWPGAVINFSTMYKSLGSINGVRIGLWKDDVWKEDIVNTDVYNKSCITIPEDCNTVSFTLYDGDEAPYINIFVDKYTENQTLVDALFNTIIAAGDDKLKGKTISILGDSISTFGGNFTKDSSGNKYADGVWNWLGNRVRYPQNDLNVTDVSQMYWKRIIDRHGMRLGVNESWAGSRVAWNGTTSRDVGLEKHIASEARISHLGENGNPDIIMVFGGSNDIIHRNEDGTPIGTFDTSNPQDLTPEQIQDLPVNTFANAYRTMLIRLQHTYKKSKFLVILPYFMPGQWEPTLLDSYNEVIKEACDYFGIKYVDARSCGMTMYNADNYLNDGLHLNDEGMKLLEIEVERVISTMF